MITTSTLVWAGIGGTAALFYAIYAVTDRFGIGWEWLRADRETRAMIRIVARIRRTWPADARKLSLIEKRASTEKGKGKQSADQGRLPRIIGVEPCPFGADITFKTVLGVGRDEFTSRAGYLADRWHAQAVRISQPESGIITARAVLHDPLRAVIPSPLIDVDTGELLVKPGSLSCHDDILLGFTEDAEEVLLNLARSAHGAIQGKTRSGKSITVNTVLAYASLMGDVRLVIIDPNLGAVAPWWRTADTVSADTSPEDAIRILEELRAEMDRRKALFWAHRTDKITDFSAEVPLILVAIDEISNFTNWADSKLANKFRAELRAVISQGAKFGIRVLLLGQKLSHDVLTTATRTNLDTRVCHRVDTAEDFKHLFPDASDLGGLTAADRTMPQGVAIVSTLTRPDPVRMRSVLLTASSCWDIADAIVAQRGERRPLPNQDPMPASEVRPLRLAKGAEIGQETSRAVS